MREILFRGKAYYGEWVEGTYYHETEFYGDDCDYHYIIRTKDVLEDNMMSYDEVIPETVGQYTGLTDKNGKKVFEGDIVCWGRIKGTIVWEEHKIYIKSNLLWDFSHDDIIEVIGNIHDNPELLKGGTDNGHP